MHTNEVLHTGHIATDRKVGLTSYISMTTMAF